MGSTDAVSQAEAPFAATLASSIIRKRLSDMIIKTSSSLTQYLMSGSIMASAY